MIDAPVLPEGEEDGADDDIGGGFGGIGDIIVLSLLLFVKEESDILVFMATLVTRRETLLRKL